ncbi:STM4015 family protein [Actinomadura algeriensis]|uniref:Leucine-rich repeat domain-containing protein n=1 Tax=Actinomadura algeriensis TaxID=1679523 RepID=A0ABR9K4Y1_9ACTN|nr:STM4015 family protein [Actinomadura algeriensis]MBE1537894.1 hypothetical protein [Actinomadura algeriensis]
MRENEGGQERPGGEVEEPFGFWRGGGAHERVATGFEETPFGEVWERFLESVDTTNVGALTIGYWGADYDTHFVYPVPLLVEAAASFPNLRSIFLGDIEAGQSEISWINHGDITPLLEAFPALERLKVRGADGLVLEPVKHESLRVLRFESGGLPAGVVRAVAGSDLPKLADLGLWLGDEAYGGDSAVDDLAPILSGERLPSLRHLALDDSQFQDEIAEAVASAPVVARLATLSLAMGTLTDRGAEALLSGQPLTHLRKLDLSYHYLSEPMMARVCAALPGVEVDLDDQQEPDEGEFYVEVAE